MRADESVLEFGSRTGSPELCETRKPRAGIFEWTTLGIFATLLALVTCRHEMWGDEIQAWLIARDSHSILSMIRDLRYEGHPALWYLVLYLPAHLWPNPATMQVINFVIAVALAWAILSTGALSRPLRLLFVFSFYFFYQYGATSRSYALAALLLVAAARCLTREKQHSKLAILFLALAVNTHAFAAPVAVLLAFWVFYIRKVKTRSEAARMLRNRDFLTAFAVLAAAGALGLSTVWPAPDLGPMFAFRQPFNHDLLTTASMVWLIFFPHLPSPVQILLLHFRASFFATAIVSVLLLSAAAALLRTNRARAFFLACAILEIVEIAVTVGWPEVYHLGFIFLSLLIALLIDAYDAPAGPLRPASKRIRSLLLVALLLPQFLCAVDLSALDFMRPYSDAREVSHWLRSKHLDQNPMVLEPSEFTTGLVGYLERPSAYYPSCRCFGSYEIRNNKRRLRRMATAEDLKIARGKSPLPVILVSNRPLQPAELRSLELKEIYVASQNALDTDSIFFVYEQTKANI